MQKKVFPWLCFSPLFVICSTATLGFLFHLSGRGQEHPLLTTGETTDIVYSPATKGAILQTTTRFLTAVEKPAPEEVLDLYQPCVLRDPLGWRSRVLALSEFAKDTRMAPPFQIKELVPLDVGHAAVVLQPQLGTHYTIFLSRKRNQPWGINNVRNRALPPV